MQNIKKKQNWIIHMLMNELKNENKINDMDVGGH